MKKPAVVCAVVLTLCTSTTLPGQTVSTWTLDGLGNWTQGTNWSSSPIAPNNGQPGASDKYSAILNRSATIVLNQDIVIESFALSVGTVTSSEDLTVNSGLTWTSGTMAGFGKTTINGTSTINGAVPVTLGRELANAGTLTISGAGVALSGTSGLIRNQNSLGITAGADFFGTGGIVNSGTLTVTGSALDSVDLPSAAYFNTGTLQVNGGAVRLRGGGASTGGIIQLATGTSLELAGTHEFDLNSSISGAGGSVAVTGGSTRIDGAYSAGSTTISGGSVSFNTAITVPTLNLQGDPNSVFLQGGGNVTITGALNWTGGQMRSTGTTTIAPGATASLVDGSNIVLARKLTNNSTTPVTLANQSLFFNGQGLFENNGEFVLSGTSGLVLQGGLGGFQNGGVFTKLGAGEATVGPGVSFANSGVVNVKAGTLTISGGGNSTAGLFTVASGAALKFGASFENDAGSEISGAGEVIFGGGTVLVQGSYSAATTTILGGNNAFNSAATMATLNLQADPNGVFLGGNGNILITGALNWTGGQMRGTGVTTIAPGAVASLAGGTNIVLSRKLINNSSSPVILSGQSLFFNNGAVWENNGTFQIVGSSGLQNQGGGGFDNRGQLTKLGAQPSDFGSGVAILNSGTFLVNEGSLMIAGTFNQTGGSTVLNSSATLTKTGSPLVIAGGRLEGVGKIVGNASLSAATLAPGGAGFGELAITGELSLFSGVALELGVGGTTQGVTYDLLSETSGTASTSLSGTTLRLSLATGYVPAFSDTFTVVESDDPLTGSFFNAATGTRLVTTDGLGSFVVRYGTGQTALPNTVVLTQFQAVPEPTTAALLGIALASLFGRRLRTRSVG